MDQGGPVGQDHDERVERRLEVQYLEDTGLRGQSDGPVVDLDRDVVVANQRSQAIGDLVEDGARIECGEDRFGDRQEVALAAQLALEPVPGREALARLQSGSAERQLDDGGSDGRGPNADLGARGRLTAHERERDPA